MAKEKIYVLNFQNDNIVACLAGNVTAAAKKLGVKIRNQKEGGGLGLAYVEMPEEPPRWYKRLKGEGQDEHRYRWKGLIHVYNDITGWKLWMLEEVPRSVGARSIEGD